MLYDLLQAISARVLDPSAAVLALLAIVAVLAGFQKHRSAASLSAATLVLVGLMSLNPLPHLLLLRPLEERFPVWQADGKDVSWIIVLGGALNVDPGHWRPGSGLSPASGRLTETIYLAQRFPHAKLLYSGGGETISEAEQGKLLLTRLGVAEDRIVTETKSRTTDQNARFSREIVAPRSSERWILVTSAFHMPRAIAAFRAAGFRPEAYPVDYRGRPANISFDFPGGLETTKAALREYVGLLAYRLTGRTEELFPRP